MKHRGAISLLIRRSTTGGGSLEPDERKQKRVCWWLGVAVLGTLLAATGLVGFQPGRSAAQDNGLSLRFYGHGVGDIDRVKISIDPQVPADVGATDFTIEWWMKATLAENGSPACTPGGDSWIHGNIVFDRDIWDAGDYGDYGISLTAGRIALGANNGSSGQTLCGSDLVADGNWHHVAVTRRRSDGLLSIFVDGQLDAQVDGPDGDISYRDGRGTPFPNDPFLVIGAEKHDAGPEYPSYSGFIDEVRLSTVLRYTSAFAPPSAPFTTDGSTVALYHLDEGPAGACIGTVIDSSGASGGPSNGTCNYGGSAPAGPVHTTDTPFAGSIDTATPTVRPTLTPTVTAIATPTSTPTPTDIATATSTNTPTPTPAEKATATLTVAPTDTVTATLAPPVAPHASEAESLSLRFYGHGVNDIDRVKIPIDPQVPADVGATDFALEWWMKATLAENGSPVCTPGGDNWIVGNIIFDRDIYGPGDYGDYGISMTAGRLAFGAHNGSSGQTLCGSVLVADGNWHHIAVTRRRSDGLLSIFVNGQLDAQVDGPDGDISYRDGRNSPYPNDPFLVIGAEKHDAGPEYPSYSGFVDEVRLSRVLRYTSAFTPPSAPFTTDGNTVALYHLDEGPAGACTGTVIDSSGASGGPSNGTCNYGGTAPAGPVYAADTPFAADTTPPVITNVAAIPADTVSTITWTTNEPATSQVTYGISPTPVQTTTESIDYTTAHSVVLTGLVPDTVYVYAVISRDRAGNRAISPLSSFRTLASADLEPTYLPVALKGLVVAGETVPPASGVAGETAPPGFGVALIIAASAILVLVVAVLLLRAFVVGSRQDDNGGTVTESPTSAQKHV